MPQLSLPWHCPSQTKRPTVLFRPHDLQGATSPWTQACRAHLQSLYTSGREELGGTLNTQHWNLGGLLENSLAYPGFGKAKPSCLASML